MITETIAFLVGATLMLPVVGTASMPIDVHNRINELLARESETNPELELVAKIVYLEAEGESDECKQAVAEVIYNRLQSGIWGDEIEDVIYAKANGYYEFESVYHIDKAKLDEDIYAMVEDVWENGSSIDDSVMYFRADYYHTWANDEFSIDNTYFSSSPWYR